MPAARGCEKTMEILVVFGLWYFLYWAFFRWNEFLTSTVLNRKLLI